MKFFKKDGFISEMGIFFIYIVASGLLIMGFRLILPGQIAPLAHFSRTWRFLQGLLEYIKYFPALALTAIIIPFGFRVYPQEKYNPFSPKFLDKLKNSIMASIVAAILYGLLSFLVLPLARNHEADLVFRGRLYRLARETAFERAREGDWSEAAQYLGVCESIWPGGPDVERLLIEVDIQLESRRILSYQEPVPNTSSEDPAVMGQTERLTPILAFELAETALAEGRYFDAHWLATTGGRLARPGSPEIIRANQIAGRAWSGVHSTVPDLLAPNAIEAETREIFRIKLDAYNSLIGNEYIRAYYIFLDLMTLIPHDPDIPRYLAISREGVRRIAFFTDEMDMTLGRVLNSAVFSLPLDSGRLVMRTNSLSTFSDVAYGMEMDILAFDREGQPLWSVSAPYIKILPMTLDTGPAVSVIMRALDRRDINGRWEPEAHSIGGNHPFMDSAEIILEISWDDFLLLSNVRRGLSNLTPIELWTASKNLTNYGHPPEIFETELLQRFTRPLYMLPLGLFAISMGWRYRTIKRARYMAIPMMGILPVVINGIEQYCRSWVNNFGVWAVLSLGFNAAAVFFGTAIVVMLILSMILLASQHG